MQIVNEAESLVRRMSSFRRQAALYEIVAFSEIAVASKESGDPLMYWAPTLTRLAHIQAVSPAKPIDTTTPQTHQKKKLLSLNFLFLSGIGVSGGGLNQLRMNTRAKRSADKPPTVAQMGFDHIASVVK